MAPDSLDVVTTATLRPELLELTYRSFTNRLFSRFRHRRLIINIDPLPEPNKVALDKTIAICHKWFPEVVCRTPAVPSFPAAVQWAWGQLESEYCFHLEDDWLLLKPIDPLQVMDYFAQSPQLAEVTLNPSRNRDNEPGLALRPSFFRKEFLSAALPLFDSALDPEKQWRGHLAKNGALDGWRFRHYGEIGEGRYVRDLGAVWRKAHALDKWDSGEVTWKSKGAASRWRRGIAQVKLATSLAIWSVLAGGR